MWFNISPEWGYFCGTANMFRIFSSEGSVFIRLIAFGFKQVHADHGLWPFEQVCFAILSQQIVSLFQASAASIWDTPGVFPSFQGQAALNIELLAPLILRSNIFSGTQARWPRVLWILHGVLLQNLMPFSWWNVQVSQKNIQFWTGEACVAVWALVSSLQPHLTGLPLSIWVHLRIICFPFILPRSLQLWVWWQRWLLIERRKTQWAAAVDMVLWSSPDMTSKVWLCWDILGFSGKIGKKVTERRWEVAQIRLRHIKIAGSVLEGLMFDGVKSAFHSEAVYLVHARSGCYRRLGTCGKLMEMWYWA